MIMPSWSPPYPGPFDVTHSFLLPPTYLPSIHLRFVCTSNHTQTNYCHKTLTILIAMKHNVLVWKNYIEACLNNKNRSTTPTPKNKNSIKRHFRVVCAKRKRGRPRKKSSKKSTPSTNNNSVSPKNVKKKPWTQSSMMLYFPKAASPNKESEYKDDPTPELVSPAPNH